MDSYPAYLKSMEQSLEEVMDLLLEEEALSDYTTERMRRLQRRVGVLQFITTERREHYAAAKSARKARRDP